jgi:uncharacterized protein
MAMDQPITSVQDPDPLLTIRMDKTGLQNPPVSAKTECADCRWRHWCGSCPYAAHRLSGDYAAKSENCRIYQEIFPRLVHLEGLRLLKEAGVDFRE